MFDLGIEKIAILGLLAMFLIGPDKLPKYAAQLGKWVRTVRGMADEAKVRMKAEMGPEFDDVEWQKLDPRRYHPRQILRDAWNSEAPTDSAPVRAERPDRDADPESAADADRVPVPVPLVEPKSDWQSAAFPMDTASSTPENH